MTKEEKKIERAKKRKETYETLATREGKQRAVTYLCYLFLLIIIVFSSTFQLIFGFENFNLTRTITNICFNIAIAIFSMILAWKDGELSNETKKVGVLADSRRKFRNAIRLITDTESFRQWTDDLYEKKKKSYIADQLEKVGIFDFEYMLVSNADLEKLRTQPIEDCPYIENGVIKKKTLDSLANDLQYYTLIKYRTGKFKFVKLEYSTIKSFTNGDAYKKYAENQNKEHRVKIFALFYRVCMIIIFSFIFALAIVNPNGEGGAEQIILDLFSRIFTAISSAFLGYTLAHDEATDLAEAFEYKTSLIEQYDVELNSGAFKPVNRTEQVIAKIKEIRDQREKENEKRDLQDKQAYILKNTPISLTDKVLDQTELKPKSKELDKYDIPEDFTITEEEAQILMRIRKNK